MCVSAQICHDVARWLGVKRVTEPNRTTGFYRTEPTETSDSCGTGFYRHHRTELFGVVSKYYLNLITRVSRFYLFKYNLLYMDS